MKKVMMLAAMLAMMLAMAAAPSLAQDADVAQDNTLNCLANGGTAIADASGGEITVGDINQDNTANIEHGDDVAIIDQDNIADQDQNAAIDQYQVANQNSAAVAQYQEAAIDQSQEADQSNEAIVDQSEEAAIDQSNTTTIVVSADGGVAEANAPGGVNECTLTVNNGDIVTGDSVVIGTIVFEGDEVTVFKDEADLFFIVIGQTVTPVDIQDVDFAAETATQRVIPVDKKGVGFAAETATPTATATTSAGGLKVLPETSGVSLITLGSGALLLVAGLVARRIIR